MGWRWPSSPPCARRWSARVRASTSSSAPFTSVGHLRHNKACVARRRRFSSERGTNIGFVFICALCAPIDAYPSVGKPHFRILGRSAGRPAGGEADELVFICFVVRSAPFSYAGCLNVPARRLDTFPNYCTVRCGGKSWESNSCLSGVSAQHFDAGSVGAEWTLAGV